MGMTFVLDTCALLALSELVDQTLSPGTIRQIAEADELVVSPISLYEMGVKWKKGQLTLSEAPAVYWKRSIASYDLTSIPITAQVLAKAYSLPDIHRDPFDRIIIAQAILLEAAVVTFDSAFPAYGIQTIC